jgi:DNA (cytosine-5)-methyltransferase 1
VASVVRENQPAPSRKVVHSSTKGCQSFSGQLRLVGLKGCTASERFARVTRDAMAKPQVISLYSGAGGLDYGFEAAGFETAVALEIDRDCCQTLRSNRFWTVIDRSIFDVRSDEILDAAQLKRGQAAVLVGGPPCQPFSKAGYWVRGESKRLDDPRASTLGGYMRVLEDTLPAVFLLENVEGLAYARKSEGLELLLSLVDDINRRAKTHYRPSFQVVKAADYGVPQLRERFIMVAARDGDEFRFPAPVFGPIETGSGQLQLGPVTPYRSAWDALGGDDPDPAEDLEMKGKWADLLPSIPEGGNYLWHTDRGGGMPLFGWRRRYWSFLLKLAKDKPSWTIQAQPGPAIGPFHWKNRRLSIRELCRLQTFPENVVVTGSRVAVQRQLGNAVPSLLAEVFARAIRTQLLGLKHLSPFPRLLPPDRGKPPRAEPVLPAPRRFRVLQGDHKPHPGTGKGYRAANWAGGTSAGA